MKQGTVVIELTEKESGRRLSIDCASIVAVHEMAVGSSIQPYGERCVTPVVESYDYVMARMEAALHDFPTWVFAGERVVWLRINEPLPERKNPEIHTRKE